MTKSLRVLSFGEILFDMFPDQARLGGAPLNLAVHLQRLGAGVSVISSLGTDDLGKKAREEILALGLSDEFIAAVPQETGRVDITLDENKVPKYLFSSDCSYDHIPLPAFIGRADLFCFGTLAQRGKESRNTLKRLLYQHHGKVFCDVNLRQNFYSKEILDFSLANADFVKLSNEELPVVTELLEIKGDLQSIAEKYDLECVIETLGPEGCRVYSREKSVSSPALPVQVVSTVGAGDSFSAAFLVSYFAGKDLEECAEDGNRLASHVAALPGAF